jgi:hypothetical protein
MRMSSIAACLALLASLVAAGCSGYGVPDAARPGVMGSGHTNPEDPGAPNGGSQ